jgi:hypothetical protein
MNYSNTIDYDSLTLIDYIDELPSSNQTKYYPKKKYNEDGSYVEIPRYFTNCVSASHNDRHPSMTLYEGDTRIVHHCYSCGNRDAINNYFHQRFIKRFSAAANGLDEQKAIEKINKEANYDPNN